MIDKERIAQFFVTQYGFLLKLAFAHAPLPEDAREITQQLYVELLDEQIEWTGMEELKSHARLLIRRLARRYRYQQAQKQSEAIRHLTRKLTAITAKNDVSFDFDGEIEALETCLNKLPEKSRKIIEAYYFKDQTIPAIGKEVEQSIGAVYQAIHRIRKRLRDCIEKHLSREIKNV